MFFMGYQRLLRGPGVPLFFVAFLPSGSGCHHRHQRYTQLHCAVCPALRLGIIVDDAIVVIENTHRIYNNGKVDCPKCRRKPLARYSSPVLAGTATTLWLPFFPLFWKGLIGKIHDLPAHHAHPYPGGIVDRSLCVQPGIRGELYETGRTQVAEKALFKMVVLDHDHPGVVFNLLGFATRRTDRFIWDPMPRR